MDTLIQEAIDKTEAFFSEIKDDDTLIDMFSDYDTWHAWREVMIRYAILKPSTEADFCERRHL